MRLAPLAGFASSVAVPWAPLGSAFIVWHFVLPAKGRERGQALSDTAVFQQQVSVCGVCSEEEPCVKSRSKVHL